MTLESDEFREGRRGESHV